ncbi:MAG: FAD-dependent oxidoreductase [Patescibacteria group bacterium]
MRKNTLWFYLYVTWEMILSIKGLLSLHVLRLQETRDEGENIRTFIFAQPKKLQFRAGQYGLWCFPRMVWGKPYRLFTIAASPTENTLQISTRIGNSDFKQKLNKLPLGTRIFMFGPIGQFTLGKKPPKAAVLIAGGIGATPMRAIAKYVHEAGVQVDLTLIHSADGYYLYREEFEAYVPHAYFVTKETFGDTLTRVAHAADEQAVFYLSGPPAFVVFAERELKKLGKKRIKKDGFLGY